MFQETKVSSSSWLTFESITLIVNIISPSVYLQEVHWTNLASPSTVLACHPCLARW